MFFFNTRGLFSFALLKRARKLVLISQRHVLNGGDCECNIVLDFPFVFSSPQAEEPPTHDRSPAARIGKTAAAECDSPLRNPRTVETVSAGWTVREFP